MKVARAILPLAFAAAASSCGLAIDRPPSVDVLDVRFVGIGLTQQELAMTLCVTNRTNEIAFQRVAVALDVSGSLLAAGASDLPVRLPSLSSTAVPSTVVTTVQNLGPQLLGVLRSGSLDYRVHGTVSLNGAFGLTLPFSKAGSLDPVEGGLNLASAATDRTPSRCSTPVAVLRT